MSETNLCSTSVGKLGMIKVKQKRIKKNPEETLTTSTEMILGKRPLCVKQWMFHTNEYQRECRSIQEDKTRKTRKQASWWKRRIKKHWWMLRMHHAVSWWASPPKNRMTYHLLGSCTARTHHKKSFRWNTSQINPKKCSHTKTAMQT